LHSASYFEAASGFKPLPFQLAWMEQGEAAPIRTLEAPTGLGKTLATLVGWLWDRRQRPESTPRRLVYQLPLRTLTDQIAEECRAVLARQELAIPVHVLRGGQIDNDYVDALAAEAVIVGTLDQVVSRQLMRGYCCSRWSWPRHFAALNTDVRVVVDETQLQGAAVRTAIRLQEMHDQLGGPAPRQLVLCSATLDAAILPAGTPRHGLSAADYDHPVAQRKVGRSKPLTLAGAADPAALVRLHHQRDTLTLVVLNQVRRAQELAAELQAGPDPLPTLLLHSRFRRAERQAIEQRLRGFRGVLVATQTVEAGIDLDARLLLTDLCPWASFVQRCGRVGRNNTYAEAAVIVLEPAASLPYAEAELAATRQRLELLGGDACVRNLMAVAAPPQPADGRRLTGERLKNVLFDTHPPDHGDIDISPYLRVGKMNDVSLLWRRQPSAEMAAAADAELCQARLSAVQRRYPSVWVPRGDGWMEIASGQLAVGSIAAVPCAAGGYDLVAGWLPASSEPVPEIAAPAAAGPAEDRSSFGSSVAVTLPQHLGDTREEAQALCAALAIHPDMAALLQRAAWLHDIGKAHPVFQATMRANGCAEGQWAKAPGWGSRHMRPGFRHELASALAAMQQGEEPLVSYLLMAHHGKIRLQLQPFPWARDGPLHGVIEGETLPAVAGVSEATVLRFPATGMGKSWRSRCGHLLQQHGPFTLAWLEALIREADARASRRWQPQPQGESDSGGDASGESESAPASQAAFPAPRSS
jgi:CRISPR-associated endonuclease/helicase Cas3